ncbi:MAG: DUF3667 domain-containing protein [Bacteroidota bacterium]|nr:DUF3667 domain-containing protein [Bacteroidota bacterium]
MKKNCKNCGTELQGEYCSNCGQHDINLQVPLKELLKEFSDELFSFDARLFRSLLPFLFKPGLLTVEYITGKRMGYISPFKLYFFMSFIFFFIFALVGDQSKELPIKNKADVVAAIDSTMTAEGIDTLIAFGDKKSFTLNATTLKDTATMESAFDRKIVNGLKSMQANPKIFLDKIKEHAPQIVFILLPFFALVMKLLYVRSNVFYIQHIIFAFNFHAFIFFTMLLIVILQNIGVDMLIKDAGWLFAAIPFNLYFGMRRVYGQSHAKTFIKFSMLGAMYSVMVIIAIIITLVITLLQL